MKDDFKNGCDVKADVPDDQKGRHYDVFEEVVLLARYLKQQGVLEAMNERVRFARRRFGRYEVIDFLVVLFGYAISGERTLEAFYQRLQPFADLPPDQLQQRPESQVVRSRYDCPEIPVGPEGVLCRMVVATHPTRKKKSSVGVTRSGVVYELFFTTLPQQAFTAADVVELYLHRGAFEPALSDGDREIDPDRWCSHSAWGQECWQVVSQWVWNLRLELGHQLAPEPLRTTEFAPAVSETKEQPSRNFWAGNDPTVRRSRTLCHLTRFGHSLTDAPGCISRSLFLGQTCFSERSLFPLLLLAPRFLLPSTFSALHPFVSASSNT